jgi:hypothetical protein
MVPIAAFFEETPANKVPSTLSHCVVAVRKKGKSVRGAWNICRSSLVKSGHLKGPYRVAAKLGQSTKQTQKGSRRTMKHSMEKSSSDKHARFKSMFRKIETDVVRKS